MLFNPEDNDAEGGYLTLDFFDKKAVNDKQFGMFPDYYADYAGGV